MPVREVLRPIVGLLDQPPRIGKRAHEAEGEVLVDLPVQVPIQLDGTSRDVTSGP
jgi:hypothetical protein